MSSRIWSRAVAVLAVLGMSSSVGCSEERAPINRVQSNALEKAFFVGKIADPADDPEFYMHVTVTDVDFGAGADGLFTNSDAQPTMRIRWEITEELLIARLTYERIDDSDGKGVRRTADGQAVAAYEIDKHFDIKRDYNESTGEELNIIVENDEDRPWYERAFFRVDWSRNLVTTAYELDTISQIGIYYGVEWEPISYYVNDPSNPDTPVFDPKRGYFDVTHKVWAKPQIIQDEIWGDFPACWLYGSFPTVNCNPSEVTLRQSYLKVTDTDYEPLEYDGTRMDMFGYFTVDRFGYDRSYGIVDDKWRRFAARWNLYQRSHSTPEVLCNTQTSTPTGADPHRDEDGDGTEDECASVGRGSRCDAVVGKCTIPLRDRVLEPVVWHVNRDFPDELFDAMNDAIGGWDDALRIAIVAGRLAECRRTGGSACEGEVGWPTRWSDDWLPPVGTAAGEVPKVFVLCHNPVSAEKGDDVGVCGKEGTSPRIGDLRYNIAAIVQQPQHMSPWGIMMDVEDPLTGEKIAGSATMWGATLDRAAATLTDLLALLDGQIAPTDFIQGKNVSEWIAANQPGGTAERGAPLAKEELDSRKNAFDPQVLSPYVDGAPKSKPGKHHPLAKRAGRAKFLLDTGRLGPGNSVLSARLAALQGSAIESQLMSPEMIQAAGYDPSGPVSAEAIRRGSPFGHENPSFRRSDRRQRRLADAGRHACRFDAPDPDNLIGLARTAKKLFPPPADPNDPVAVNQHRNDVRLWARQEYTRGVMAHELGHSVGLRHNFAASFDSLNYSSEYWQLRTVDGSVTDSCADGTTDGAPCIGPRWRDPVSDVELDGNINRYATTSVMDYPGEQSQDMLLPGKYDRAAVRFAYGGVVDVWSTAGVSVDGTGAGQAEAYALTAFDTSPGLFGVYYFPPVDPAGDYEFIHYSEYQNRFGLIADCAADAGATLGTKCQEREMDVVDYRDMKDFASDPDYAAYPWAVAPKAVDSLGRVRRGYAFSSDEYADAGNVPSMSDDAGADAYEQIRFLEAAYENRYILDSFRRNRVDFNSDDVTSRIQYRYLDNIQLLGKTWAFGAVLDGDPTAPTSDLLADGYYAPLALGATVGLDLFARMLTRGEPGHYCPADVCGSGQPVGVATEVFAADPAELPDVFLYDFRVALGDGRYLHNDFDYGQGYFWGDYQTQVGTYYDKIWATYYLAEAFDTFISNSKEDFYDSRYKNVNYATVFPAQLRRLYASVLTGDLDTFAPWVSVKPSDTDTPLGTLTYPTWHDAVDTGARSNLAKLVDPNFGWNPQLYAMVWGTMYFSTNWSNSWVNDSRIVILDSEQPSWPVDEIVRFFYPPTGLTYRARGTGTETLFGQTREKAVGARMLAWANHLMTLAYVVQTDVGGQPLFNPDGTPQLELDVNGKPQENPGNPGAKAALAKYVDTIDIFRQLVSKFEMPLGDGDLPRP